MAQPDNRTKPIQITMSLTNLFQYISFTSPLLIIFFVTLYAIMLNKLVSGLIFNMGIVIISAIVYILKNVLKNKQNVEASPFCNILPGPFTVRSDANIFDAPSMSTTILSFTATYLIFPMMSNNQMNIPLLLFLIAIISINSGVEFNQSCSGIMGIILGLILGIVFGIIYYSILIITDKNLVFFSDTISNNVQCSKPTNQNFKCEFYKDGKPYALTAATTAATALAALPAASS